MLTRTIAIIFGVAAVAVLNALISQPLNGNIPEARLAEQDSKIRTVDFANFSYSAEPIYKKVSTFKLVNGDFQPPPYDPNGEWPASRSQVVSLVTVAYGDVTGDAIEEAMVVLFEDVNGTAIPYYVYVYTIESTQPKLLWAFAAGDRAQGGLRKVYSDQGELVVELYGDGARVDGEIYVNAPNGACCPTLFTRTHYRWFDGEFASTGKSKVLPADGTGSLKMEIPKRD
jgi:hypothetical protein